MTTPAAWFIARRCSVACGHSRRYSYRVSFATRHHRARCCGCSVQSSTPRACVVTACARLLADPAAFTYKRSRRGDCEIDRVVEYVTRSIDPRGHGSCDSSNHTATTKRSTRARRGSACLVGRLTQLGGSDGADTRVPYHSSADISGAISAKPARSRALDGLQAVVELLSRESIAAISTCRRKGEPRLG